MRPLPIILALSLAANAVLAIAWNSARHSTNTPSQTPALQTKVAGASSSFDATRLANAIKTNNYAEIYAQLNDLGVGDVSARTITASVIWSKYYSRQRDILAAKNNNNTPYWRGVEKTSALQLTAAERKELRDLSNQARREELNVFGTTNVYGGLEVVSARYNFLPPEKVAQLEDLQRDYSEMSAEIAQESMRFKLPSDAKQLQILRDEFRNDLASILTPEELTAYDQHFSSTAMLLRRSLASIDISEPEYLAIYDAMKPGSSNYPQRFETIQNMLGDDRFAAFQRQLNPAYQALLAAADRFDIPIDTINNVYGLRDTVASESQRIASDSTLSPAEKKQALQDLAENMRSQVRAQLGDDVGDAYLQMPSMSWLQRVSNGASIALPSGGGKLMRVVTPPANPNAPRSPSVKGTNKKGGRRAPQQ